MRKRRWTSSFAVRAVVTQALFAVLVLTAINARRHDWQLVAVGEIIGVGLAATLAALLLRRR